MLSTIVGLTYHFECRPTKERECVKRGRVVRRASDCLCNFVWLVGWLFNVLVNNKAILWTGPKTERLTILRAATHEIERGDHDFCLSRSHYADTDP